MPDLFTILLLLALGSAVLGVSILVMAARTEHYPGFATWGVALLVNSLAHVAFGLRLLDWTTVSILASNLLTPLALVLFMTALVRFHRLALPRWAVGLLWSSAPLALVIALLTLDQHRIRNVLVVSLHMLLMLAIAWAAWRRPRDGARGAGHLLVMAGALGMALAFMARLALMATNTDWPGPLFVPPAVQVGTYLVVFVALLTNTLGFALMQMEHAIERQHDLATHDPLTGAFNRRALLEAMARLAGLAQRQRQPLSVLMIDIDHFKRVNDEFGHANGDVVLQEVARRLQERLRRSDLLARFGGEEFLVLLPDTGAAQAAGLAETLRTSLSGEPIRLHDASAPLQVTVSIGVHTRVPGGAADEVEQMVVACDRAMYRAKALGRNRVEIDAGQGHEG